MCSATIDAESVAEAGTPRLGPGAAEDLAVFHRTLAELCRARMPLPQALRLLGDDLRGGLGEQARSMVREVEEGVSLGEAYARRRSHFPPAYRALVEAGIAAGDLPGVLEEIAAHAGARAAVAERLRRAFAYPLAAAAVVVLVGLALVVVATPFAHSFSANVIGSSDVLSPVAGAPSYAMTMTLVVAALLLAAGICLAIFWLRNPIDAGAGPRGLGYRIPLIGGVRSYAAKASFASTLAVLLRRRVPLARALELTAATSDDAAVRDSTAKMARRAEDGADLAEAVRAGDLVSPALLGLVEAAAKTDTAAEALDDVAMIYRRRLERSVDRVCVLAPPAAELAVGLVVLAFALAYMFPAIRFGYGVFHL